MKTKRNIISHLIAFAGIILCFTTSLESQNTNLEFFDNSNVEIFLHVPILFENRFKRTDPAFPAAVLSLVEESSEKTPLSVALGINFKIKDSERVFLQTGAGYQKIPQRQKIEVMADQENTFTIERNIINEAFALPVVLLVRPAKSPRLGFYAGLELSVLREKWKDEEWFIFKQLEDLNNSPLLNELNLQQNNRETTVFRQPTMPIRAFWYWDVQFKMGATYRLPITSGLALDLNANWVPAIRLSKNNQFKVNGQYAAEDWWGDHYYLKNDGKHLDIREYLAFRLVYTFNQQDWVLKKIGVTE